jgi:hypothetical protein
MALASSVLMLIGSPQTLLGVASTPVSLLVFADTLSVYGRHVGSYLAKALTEPLGFFLIGSLIRRLRAAAIPVGRSILLQHIGPISTTAITASPNFSAWIQSPALRLNRASQIQLSRRNHSLRKRTVRRNQSLAFGIKRMFEFRPHV